MALSTELTDEALRLARMGASQHVHVRPMFQLLAEFADVNGPSGDAAKWPEPFDYHDIELGEEA